MPLPNRLIERFSFGGRTIAPLLSASLTAILTFAMAWSPHGPSDPGLSSSARQLACPDVRPWSAVEDEYGQLITVVPDLRCHYSGAITAALLLINLS